MSKNYDFFSACKNGNIRKIKLCLERGEDINKNFSKRWVSHLTPLSTLFEYRKYEALKYLILYGENLNFNILITPDTFLLDHIEYMYYLEKKDVIHMMKRGATFFKGGDTSPEISGEKEKILPGIRNFNSVDRRGNNFLLCSFQNNFDNDFIIELLQREDLDINHQNSVGFTALHYVCKYCNKFSIQRFLDLRRDADVNIEDERGNTPLFYIEENNLDQYKPLIDVGADIFIKNKNGRNFFRIQI